MTNEPIRQVPFSILVIPALCLLRGNSKTVCKDQRSVLSLLEHTDPTCHSPVQLLPIVPCPSLLCLAPGLRQSLKRNVFYTSHLSPLNGENLTLKLDL